MAGGGLARSVAECVSWWAALVVLYLMFIQSIEPLELVVGCGSAALLAPCAVAGRKAAGVPVQWPSRGWWRPALAWPRQLVADTGAVAALAWRGLRRRPADSEFRDVRLDCGLPAPYAALLLSATPGAYVIAADERTMRLHGLGRAPSPLERALAGGQSR